MEYQPGSQEDFESHLDDMAKDMEERGRIATALMDKDPQLNYISAIIIAGDMMGAERGYRNFVSGEWDLDRALTMTGSYGRLALKVRLWNEGRIDVATAVRDLPDEWSGSDPDDTDPALLRLWRAASDYAGGRLLVQDMAKEPLPQGDQRGFLKVYRGQDRLQPGEKFGIAWSTDQNVAEKFARGAATRQSNRWGVVYRSEVRRDHVIAWMPNRGEAEVIIDPRDLTRVKVIDAPIPKAMPR